MGDDKPATPSTIKSPFPNFSQLAPSTWYYQPLGSEVKPDSSQQLDLVILSTWMGAASKHILKYTAAYQKIYPNASLLVLTNGVQDFFRTSSHHEQHLRAAISVIRSTHQQNPQAKILLHLFSNGGAHTICQLARFYRKYHSELLPLNGTVLDSAPGRATYKRSIAAMSVGLPSFFPIRIFGILILHIACIVMWLQRYILGRENVITRVRRELNDPLLFPTDARRVYIYSKTDEMVDWETVEEHAAEAEQDGVVVQRERFGNSRHVGHMMEDFDRYWGAIGKVFGGS
ncbi:indole-diterpene biosynthesis protein-like protein PaxU [Venturia nashicola]|nr:indole-diterpene biosynthesis protein-like protein PaxU [Venturia nashicola]